MAVFLSLSYSFTSSAFNVKSNRKFAVHLPTDFLPYRMCPLIGEGIQYSTEYKIVEESVD